MLDLYLEEEKRITGSQIQQLRWTGSDDHVVALQKLACFEGIVSRHVVVLEHPFANMPQFRPFVLNASNQIPQIVKLVSCAGDLLILMHKLLNSFDKSTDCAQRISS